MLEAAVFWVRLFGIMLTVLGVVALAVSGYLGSRLAAERAAEVDQLRARISGMEERYTRELEEARRPKTPEMRVLSFEDHRALVRALQPFAGERAVVISAQDWEPANFAHQIIKSMRTAGLDVRVTYYSENASVPEGIEAVWMNGGQRIAAALKAGGLDVKEMRGPTRGDVPLELRIGTNTKKT